MIGDESLFWYAPWPEPVSNGVRLYAVYVELVNG